MIPPLRNLIPTNKSKDKTKIQDMTEETMKKNGYGPNCTDKGKSLHGGINLIFTNKMR